MNVLSACGFMWPILCFSDEKFPVGLGSPTGCLGVSLVATTCLWMFCGTLFTFGGDVVYVEPGWILKGSSCVLDEEGVVFIWI